jgi:hypothetical protein
MKILAASIDFSSVDNDKVGFEAIRFNESSADCIG